MMKSGGDKLILPLGTRRDFTDLTCPFAMTLTPVRLGLSTNRSFSRSFSANRRCVISDWGLPYKSPQRAQNLRMES